MRFLQQGNWKDRLLQLWLWVSVLAVFVFWLWTSEILFFCWTVNDSLLLDLRQTFRWS